MRKLSLIVGACALLLPFSVSSQNAKKDLKQKIQSVNSLHNRSLSYYFYQRTENYTELSNDISLSNGIVWDDPDYIVPVSFDFFLLGNKISEIMFDGLGADLMAITMDGTTPTAFSLISPFGADIIDRGSITGVSQSPISYKVDGNPGNQILKIQWKNVGGYGDNNLTMFINFQLWLYEGSNNIEVRFGPNNINNPGVFYEGIGGPGIGFTGLDPTTYQLIEPHFLSGQVPNLVLSNNMEPIKGTPGPNSVYLFTKTPITLNVEKNSTGKNMVIYPNPASDIIRISNFDPTLKNTIRILDITGKTVRSSNLNTNAINVSNLENGVYFIQISNEKESRLAKFVKN